MASAAQRQRLVEYAQTLVDHASHIHYAEIRPMRSLAEHTWASVLALFKQGGYLTMDCSESVTSLFRWAGLRDPNGLGYNGEGFTGTLLGHLKHYAQTADANPGALGVFGKAPGTHVVMLMERAGDNPWVFSHGQEAGPFRIQLSQEKAAHAGEPFTWLDISGL